MDQRLSDYFDTYYPERYYERRSDAWQTIGVLPSDVTLPRGAGGLRQGQVLGFYNRRTRSSSTPAMPISTGSSSSSLTRAHARDRRPALRPRPSGRPGDARSEDEPFEAALGIVEKIENHFATQVIIRYPNPDSARSGGRGRARSRRSSPVELQAFPYTAGQRFADELSDAERACRDGRTHSTRSRPRPSRCFTPSKFPDEDGVCVDVADLGSHLRSRLA